MGDKEGNKDKTSLKRKHKKARKVNWLDKCRDDVIKAPLYSQKHFVCLFL